MFLNAGEEAKNSACRFELYFPDGVLVHCTVPFLDQQKLKLLFGLVLPKAPKLIFCKTALCNLLNVQELCFFAQLGRFPGYVLSLTLAAFATAGAGFAAGGEIRRVDPEEEEEEEEDATAE